jgi:serine/threonine-protein kinase
MGVVYVGRDTRLDRLVAIKLLNKRFERNADNIRRFVQEAKAASALNHPNILTIFEIGEIDGSHYIVSEYIEGRTLRDLMRSEKLELRTIIDIVSQIAGALAAAHKARIVHRDIKPENIIVRDDGYVKVLDFGLAKLLPNGDLLALDDDTRRQNTTASGIILGTVNYMSPEQAKGKKVDERTDIFSLGVVLYEMLTGKAPFAGDSVPETFARLIEHEPEPIDTYHSGVSDEMQQVVSRMLEKAPENRYQSVREAADDLKALHGSPSGSLLDGSRQPISENRTAVMQQTTVGGANTTAENAEPTIRWYRRWPVMAALGVLVLVGVSLGGYSLLQKTGLSSNEIRSVAVMPFVNESGNPDVEYLSDGMTDTLISSLSELPNLKVKARTSVFRYKGKEIDPKAIGRELGVQAIVNGRVTQHDGRTSVSLEVVDAETEDLIFSTTYNKPQSELVTLQRDIARDVSGKLKSKLSGAEEAKVTKTYTADPEALQLYLQGQFYRYKGGRNNVQRATDYFKKAIEKDPNYALAYAGLTLNYSRYSFYSLTVPFKEANAAAKRALELDDSLAEAHVASAYFVGDWEQEFRRAIELNPNYAEAYDGLCIFRTYQKRFDEAIAEGKKALELDPSSVLIATDLGAAHFFARRFDESIEILKRAHDMDPDLWVPLGWLGAPQMAKGQYTEAVATFRKAMEVGDGSPNPWSHLAYALAKTGQRDEALKLLDELKRQAQHERIDSFHFVMPYIGLGDKDEAFFWLGKGVDEGSIGFTTLEVHPWFDDLRSDPRFTALLNRAKRPGS